MDSHTYCGNWSRLRRGTRPDRAAVLERQWRLRYLRLVRVLKDRVKQR
jgi:hypothetical protein